MQQLMPKSQSQTSTEGKEYILCLDASLSRREEYEKVLGQNYSIHCLDTPTDVGENCRGVVVHLDTIGEESLDDFLSGLNDIPVLILYSDIPKVLHKYKDNLNIDYLKTPFQSDEFAWRVAKSISDSSFANDMRNLVETQVNELHYSKNATIFALAELAESRDKETGGHLRRIRRYSKSLAIALSKTTKYKKLINAVFIENIFHVSVLHDIGKVSIPDAVLLKPAPLTEKEFEVIKKHAAIGGQTLQKLLEYSENDELIMARDIAKHHHEHWDGSGYPNALRREEIPLAARIVAYADIFDALSTKRVYKEAFGDLKVFSIMQDEAGKTLDPNMFESFQSVWSEFIEIKNKYASETKFCCESAFSLHEEEKDEV